MVLVRLFARLRVDGFRFVVRLRFHRQNRRSSDPQHISSEVLRLFSIGAGDIHAS